MGLDHEFFLLSQSQYPIHNRLYEDINDIRCDAMLDDDLLHYMRDTLLWVATYNPSTKEQGMGLNYYGLTIVNQQGASSLKVIVDAWISLFSQSPKEDIALVGFWTVDNDNEGGGYYSKLHYRKQNILPNLKTIRDMADAVLLSKELYILHLGI